MAATKEYLHASLPNKDHCEVHDWTREQWETDFVKLLRERHGKGGLTVCTDCLKKARDDKFKA